MRLIDADAVIPKGTIVTDDVIAVHNALAKAPTIDAGPVKHGRWIDPVYHSFLKLMEATCSSCEVRGSVRFKPNECGFKEAIKYLRPIADSASLERYKDALELAISALRFAVGKDMNVPACEWISVKERLPVNNTTVLIRCKNGAMFTGYPFPYYDDTVRWRIHTALSSTKLLNAGRVTHWMPLPEPPKEV